ncbi:MAG: hypothetical protein K1V84_01180 [Muribaculaceae bacterium]
MKKILFNDKFGLTQAVLDGRKTQTRQILGYENYTQRYIEKIAVSEAKYKLGEVVAVAQSYKDAGIESTRIIKQKLYDFKLFPAHAVSEIQYTAGWKNKMFVRADLMPHRIRITNVRVERLNDISRDDCLAEGIGSWECQSKRYYGFYDYTKDCMRRFDSPREAYAALIDRISGRGTWESNPYVFVYDFELVK